MHVVTDSGSGRARECDEQPVAEIQSSLTTGILKNHRNDAEVRGLCYGVKREAASRSGTSQNPQNTNTKSNTNLKHKSHVLIVWGGDFWGMHRIDLVGLSILGLLTVW